MDGVTLLTNKYLERKEELEAFAKAKEEYYATKQSMGNFIKFWKKLPSPEKTGSLLFLAITLFLMIGYAPSIVDWYIMKYKIDQGMMLTLLTSSFIVNLGLTLLLAVILLLSGQVVKVWLKAGITKKPVLSFVTKNKTKEFVIPKEVTPDLWDINDKQAILVDSDAVYTGPHKVPIMDAVPEFCVGVNIRSLLTRQQVNIDTTAVKLYALSYANRVRKDIQSGMDAIRPLMMPLIILVVIGLIFVPIAEKRMDQQDDIQKLQNEVITYRIRLVDNGINPDTGKIFDEQPAPIQDVSVKKNSNTVKSETGVVIQ